MIVLYLTTSVAVLTAIEELLLELHMWHLREIGVL
jgi:hypothetical protein